MSETTTAPVKKKLTLLSDKDIERANQIVEKKEKQKELDEVRIKKQKKERREYVRKKAKALLNTYEKSKYYKETENYSKEALEKYKRKRTEGEEVKPFEIGNFQYRNAQRNKEEVNRKIRWSDVDKSKAEAKLARSEILRTEHLQQRGIELDENDIFTKTSQLTQDLILNNLDENTRKKVFDIELTEYSPYKIQYSLSSRKLLLGGTRGHLSVLEWRKLKSQHENVLQNDSVRAIQWLMDDGMYAVAQSPHTYVYDENGREIHFCRDFYQVQHLTYLPFHYLLVGATKPNLGSNTNNQIIYKDISLGENVATIKLDPINCLTHNPYNAVVCTGHLNGTVSMVLPRDSNYKPVVSMFCHQAPIKNIAIDPKGIYMVTSAADDQIKVWDIRKTYQPVTTANTIDYPNKLSPKIGDHITNITISQTGMTAISLKHSVAIYKDILHVNQSDKEVYLYHQFPNHITISDLQFCPYEDILGVGHSRGFSSLIIPGAGSSSFDSRLPNPYFTDKQVKDFNVRTLLEKIPADMICLDPTVIGTSGMREKDHTYNSKVEVTNELKEELKRVGLVEKEKREEDRKKKLSSRDLLREELYNKNSELKGSVPSNWFEEEDPDALDRFASLKKRKTIHDKIKYFKEKEEQEEIEAKERAEEIMNDISSDEEDDSEEEEESKEKVSTKARENTTNEEEEDEEDEDDEEEDTEENLPQSSTNSDNESSSEEEEESDDEDEVVDPFA
ncbi:hypothetical protein ABK040_005832 [Willaertia magna]